MNGDEMIAKTKFWFIKKQAQDILKTALKEYYGARK